MQRKLFIDMKITSYYLFFVFIALNDGEFSSQKFSRFENNRMQHKRSIKSKI